MLVEDLLGAIFEVAGELILEIAMEFLGNRLVLGFGLRTGRADGTIIRLGL